LIFRIIRTLIALSEFFGIVTWLGQTNSSCKAGHSSDNYKAPYKGHSPFSSTENFENVY